MIAFSSALYSATVASCSNVLLFKLLLQCCHSTTISVFGVTIFGFCHRLGCAHFSLQSVTGKNVRKLTHFLYFTEIFWHFFSLPLRNIWYDSETSKSTWEWAAQLEVFTLNNFLCLLILTTLMDYKENQKKNSKTVEWGIFFRKVFRIVYVT